MRRILPLVLAVFAGCSPGPDPVPEPPILTDEEVDVVRQLHQLKTRCEQLARKVKSLKDADAKARRDVPRLYEQIKTSHDEFIDLVNLQVEQGEEHAKAIEKKAGEVQRRARAFEGYVGDLVTAQLACERIAPLLVETGQRLWVAYEREKGRRLGQLKQRVKGELENARLKPWNIIDPIGPW